MSYFINDDETWGQFIDIENGYLIHEQLVIQFKTQRPFKNQISVSKPVSKPVPLIKSILKPSSTKPFPNIPSPRPKKTNEVDYNDALNKIIERQIYLGCFICILTLGIFILP